MSAVPQGLREGAFGLGATKLQVSTGSSSRRRSRASSPRSCSAISRAIGETMIVLIAAGQIPNTRPQPDAAAARRSPLSSAPPAKGDNPTGTIGYKTIFAGGMTLFVLTLIMNVIAIRFVRKYRQVYE